MPPSPTLLVHPDVQQAVSAQTAERRAQALAGDPEHEPMWDRETFRRANGETVELIAVGRSINEAAAAMMRLARRLVRNAPAPSVTATQTVSARIDLGR